MPKKLKTPDAVHRSLHEAAVQRGADFYIDPRTRLFVLTALKLKKVGKCCGSGCMWCPWPVEEQRRAGRPGVE